MIGIFGLTSDFSIRFVNTNKSILNSVCLSGTEESALQWHGSPHSWGDRDLRQEGPADTEWDARGEGVLLRVRARHAGPCGVQPGRPAGHGGQRARLPPPWLPGGRLQEPRGSRQQDEGQMLGRPLGRGHWRGDGPQPPHPQGQCQNSQSV